MQDASAVVIDHGSYAVSGTEGDHTLIAADDIIQSDVLLGSTKIEVRECIEMFFFSVITILCYVPS